MKKIFTILIGILCFSGFSQPDQSNIAENKNKLYAIQLLEHIEENEFQEYVKSLNILLRTVGGYVERTFNVDLPSGNIEGLGRPELALVIFYGDQVNKSKAATNMVNQSLSSLKVKAITFNGLSIISQTSSSALQDRFYLMKISYFKANLEGRENMLAAIGPILDKFSFRTERMISGKSAVGMSTPDEITIHFHDTADQAIALRQDTDAMQAIGQYNEKYVDKFAYLPLSPRQAPVKEKM